MTTEQPRIITRDHNPYPRTDLTVGEDDIARYDLPSSLLASLERWVSSTPDAEALVELGSERLSYRELWDRSARVAGGLRAAGVGRGDRVAIRFPAGVHWVLGFWGTVMAGGIAVVPNTRSAPREIDFVLDDAGVSIDLTSATGLPDGEPFVVEDLASSDPAALFYTSGTTGHPKGVPTTHEAFLTNNENLMRCLGTGNEIGDAMRTLISVPLFHVTGCNAQLMLALHVGGAAVIMPELDQAEMLETLTKERISYLVTVPAVYALLLRRPELATTDVSSVRWLGYGGAAIAPSLVEELRAAFPEARVFNGYGMTETAPLLSVLPHEDAVDHADSVGYAVPSVDLAVLPHGEDPSFGELLARGATVMKGYWNRPDATADALAGGWMHTGDVVRVDEAGRVHIVDRIKDIIIRGGENISSLEVEGVLVGAPGVLEAAVVAVPDDVMGEKVGAVVFGGGAEVDVDAVIEHCRENLADFKVPQYLNIAASALPRNAGGKLVKSQLRDATEWGAPLR